MTSPAARSRLLARLRSRRFGDTLIARKSRGAQRRLSRARPRSSADRAAAFEAACGGSTPPGAIASRALTRDPRCAGETAGFARFPCALHGSLLTRPPEQVALRRRPRCTGSERRRRKVRRSSVTHHRAPAHRQPVRSVGVRHPGARVSGRGGGGRMALQRVGFRERLGIGSHRAQLTLAEGALVVTQLGDAGVVSPPAEYPDGERQYTAEDVGGHR